MVFCSLVAGKVQFCSFQKKTSSLSTRYQLHNKNRTVFSVVVIKMTVKDSFEIHFYLRLNHKDITA